MNVAISPDIPAAARSHSAKRSSVFEAAACVFCREGFAGANLDMIAMEAGVSRQTIYNHHGDKERLFLALVKDMAERINAQTLEALGSFPAKSADLQADLTDFAVRMFEDCARSREGLFMRKLLQREGERYPELFSALVCDKAERMMAALAANFARLALDGRLAIRDPDVAAPQFMALVRAGLEPTMTLGAMPAPEAVKRASSEGVATFLRAYAVERGAGPG